GVPKGPALWGNPMPPRPEGSEWRSQILAEGRDVCSRPLEVCFMGGVLAPAACSTGIIISPSSGSVKRLLLLGHHLDMDLQGFIAAAEPDSADRAGLQVVAPDREPKVGRPGRPLETSKLRHPAPSIQASAHAWVATSGSASVPE